MESNQFDYVTRILARSRSRRTTIGAIAATLTAFLVGGQVASACKRAGGKCRRAGQCCSRKCKKRKGKKFGKCRGSGRSGGGGGCPTGQKPCNGGCIPNDETCNGPGCPTGQKPCEGGCIPDNQCCGGCDANLVCCTNVGECKDTRNDSSFCGQCTNAQCPGGAFCANGDCGLTCTTIGEVCFGGCNCAVRIDPAHLDQQVCGEPGPGGCDFATECTDDSDCGFRRVCVSDLCEGKNVCANPCA